MGSIRVFSKPFLLVIICSLLTSPALSKGCYKISYWDCGTPEVQVGKLMISEMYHKVGLCHQFIEMPGTRAFQALKSGEVDANLWRTEEFLKASSPEIEFIKEPIGDASISIFYDRSQHESFDIKSSLKGRTVGILRGSLQDKAIMEKYGARTMPLDGYERLYRVLTGKRLSAGIMPSTLFHSFKEKIGANEDIKEAVIHQTKIYHVIGERLKKFAPELTAALVEVKHRGGFYDRLKPTN
ncbi:transporter substrate-binding domain-containing protein [Sneathiella glossodoripedis]|uniref:transporter substrate-binding domain-containing protein n=1 Tax=Sneathiella glossodoripedis TaxID=418853 RepID=UPI000471911A|nr:transporter substrate-binding domain-containing protein [Sneathiella glossodoripedis]